VDTLKPPGTAFDKNKSGRGSLTLKAEDINLDLVSASKKDEETTPKNKVSQLKRPPVVNKEFNHGNSRVVEV
jgi:hypothetical protein